MPIPDRQKQRREYLRKKAVAYSKIYTGKWLFSLLITVPIAFGFFGCACLVFAVTQFGFLIPAVILFLLMMGSGYGCWKIIDFVEKAEMDSLIPYVPPVTANTLPAAEVLVRASQEPVQEQSTVLLRASESTETPAEELLRASVGEQREV